MVQLLARIFLDEYILHIFASFDKAASGRAGGYQFHKAPQPSPGGPEPETSLHARDSIKANPVACYQSQEN